MNAELREDVLDMMPHGVRAYVELVGDLPIRRSPRQETRNLRFTRGEPEASESRLRGDVAVVRETYGDTNLERRKQQSEQRSRCVSWARTTRPNGALDVTV